METPSETASEELWAVTELEAAARDMVDVGFWESAEEEEERSSSADSVPTAPLSTASIPQAAYDD